MIHRVFDFGARRASEVMTPRDRIFSLDIEMPVAQLVAEIAHENFWRVPVYRHSQDNIVGILHAKDLAARRLEPSPPRVERLVRPAYFVPPGKRLADLFDEMRRGRFQIALVVNEYGRLLGLVTLEDLLRNYSARFATSSTAKFPIHQSVRTMGGVGRGRAGPAGGRPRSRTRDRCLRRRQDAEQPDPSPARARAAFRRKAEAR